MNQMSVPHTRSPDPVRPEDLAVSTPIYQTSLFAFRDFADMAAAYAGDRGGPIYQRGDNPTVNALEAAVARLEGAEAARSFASGMSAIAAAVMAFVKAGDRIVTIENLYSDAFRLFETLLRPLGVEIDYVPGGDAEAVERALPGARLLFLESPTSLTFDLQDLPRLAAAARREGVLTLIDNSWATPVFQRPIEHGIDLVIHAASKYLCGHSDTVAGVVAGRRELVGHISTSTFVYMGGKLSPIEAWLLLRGLETLPLRMERHRETGLRLAQALEEHPAVTGVLHPALSDHPGRRTLTGTTSLFSILLDETIDIPAFCNALGVFRLGVSWGGPESLVVPAEAVLHQRHDVSAFRRFSLDPRLVRLYAGLEPAEVLLADLRQALSAGRR